MFSLLTESNNFPTKINRPMIKNLLCLFILASLSLSCSSKKEIAKVDTGQEIPEQFRGKVLVTLIKETLVSDIEADFVKYSLEHLAIASKSKNQHLFQYDSNKISLDNLLKKLNKSKKVYSAEALEYQIKKAQGLESSPKKNVDVK